MRFSNSLALSAFVAAAKADTHHLIVGTFLTPYLYTLEFDDAALTLGLVKNTSVTVSSSWISLSVRNLVFLFVR